MFRSLNVVCVALGGQKFCKCLAVVTEITKMGERDGVSPANQLLVDR